MEVLKGLAAGLSIIVILGIIAGIIVAMGADKMEESKMNIKEVFTIQETDQYKYECLVNTFLENGWEIENTAIYTTSHQPDEWTTIWSTIVSIENASTENKAKEVERKALNKWDKLKEER